MVPAIVNVVAMGLRKGGVLQAFARSPLYLKNITGTTSVAQDCQGDHAYT